MVDFAVSPTIGNEIYKLIIELYPICRSITGNGVRETLGILGKYIPLELHEVPTGTQVFDWVIPKEWNIRDAFIKNAAGEKIVDFKHMNLHVLNYSTPVRKQVRLPELKEHLFSIPELVDLIPYRTSYYKENWGFCITHRLLENLADEDYEVEIDSSLEEGSLTYGEFLVNGSTDEEFLISCHCCHPSLCNDNLSGLALATLIAQYLSKKELRYSYRFLFIPGTIGSITWLYQNQDKISKIKHGLVVACVGDPGKMHYKKTRRGDAEIDRVVTYVLSHSGQDFDIRDFSPFGYDERQYCSPGFNLPVGSLTRTPHGKYPEYHTSADNLDLVRSEFLADSFNKYLAVINIIENNRVFLNTNPFCEPQLGRRGLYGLFGGRKDANVFELALLWVLNLSDGQNNLLDIAERSRLPWETINEAASALKSKELLKEI